MAGERGNESLSCVAVGRGRELLDILANLRASFQIVYTAIVGLVMLAACLEWFLWIAAFMYCLWKVFVKAEHWTVRVLSVIIGIAFMLLRYVCVQALTAINV